MPAIGSGRRQAPAAVRTSTANSAPAPPPSMLAANEPSGAGVAATVDQSVSLSNGFQSTDTVASSGSGAAKRARTSQTGAVGSAGSIDRSASAGGAARGVASQTAGSGSVPANPGGAAATTAPTSASAVVSAASAGTSSDQWKGS